MTRLAATMLALALFAAPVLSFATTQEWRFKVSLDDREIGYQRFAVLERAGTQTVRIRAHFAVDFLWFNAYSYEHHNVEIWRDGCLQRITSSTDDNGELQAVRGVATANSFRLEKPESRTISGCVMTYAYWNPRFLKQERLLNPQTGEMDRVKVRDLGEERITVRQRAVRAKHYALMNPKVRIDLWYSLTGEWLALESTLESGRRLRYQLQ